MTRKEAARRFQALQQQNDEMRALLIAIEPRCEYVGCERPGPHVTHTIGGSASATPAQQQAGSPKKKSEE